MYRLRLLEHGVVDEKVLPDGIITVDLVSATIQALICDDRSRRNDHDDDARRWADCELAGQLCNLYQVMRCYTVNCATWSSCPQIAHPSALLRHRSTCGQSFTSLPCSMLHRAMISVLRGIPEKLRTGSLLSMQIAVVEIICPVGICGAPWAKGRLWLIPPALGCIITSQTQSCRFNNGPVA